MLPYRSFFYTWKVSGAIELSITSVKQNANIRTTNNFPYIELSDTHKWVLRWAMKKNKSIEKNWLSQPTKWWLTLKRKIFHSICRSWFYEDLLMVTVEEPIRAMIWLAKLAFSALESILFCVSYQSIAFSYSGWWNQLTKALVHCSSWRFSWPI